MLVILNRTLRVDIWLVILRFLLLIAILVAAVVASTCAGELLLSPAEVWQSLSGAEQYADILMQVRVPRLLAAALVGTALAVSGYLMQSLSGNSLADPYITGVSSGAGLTAVLAMILGADFMFLPVIAWIGGLASSALVVCLARTPAGMSVHRLLLSGVAISAVCGSIITLLLSLAGNDKTFGIIYWLAGSVNGRSWQEVAPAAVYISCGLVLALIASKPLRILSLGSTQAGSLGLKVERAQSMVLAASVLLAATAVSLSGLVGFVGMMAPYFARRLFGRDERLHILSTAMLGASLVLISDLLARIMPGQELPLGTLLALLGGPFFVFLILGEGGSRADVR